MAYKIIDKALAVLNFKTDSVPFWQHSTTAQKRALLDASLRAWECDDAGADATYYVNQTTGNDGNTGLSGGAAFATFNGLVKTLGQTVKQRTKVYVTSGSTALSVAPLTKLAKLESQIVIIGQETSVVQAVTVVGSITDETAIDSGGSTVSVGSAINVGTISGSTEGQFEGYRLKCSSATNSGNVGYNLMIVEHYKSGSDNIFVIPNPPSAITVGDVFSLEKSGTLLKGSSSHLDGGNSDSMTPIGYTWVNINFYAPSGSGAADYMKFEGNHHFYGASFQNDSSSLKQALFTNASLIRAGRYSSTAHSWVTELAKYDKCGIGQIAGSYTANRYALKLNNCESVSIAYSHVRRVDAFNCAKIYFFGLNGIRGENSSYTFVCTRCGLLADTQLGAGKIKLNGSSGIPLELEQSYFYNNQTLDVKGAYGLEVRYHSYMYIDPSSRINTVASNNYCFFVQIGSSLHMHGASSFSGVASGINIGGTVHAVGDFTVSTIVSAADFSYGVRVS